MNTAIKATTRTVLSTIILACPDLAQTGGGFDLTWSTVDGGGGMNSVGGAYSLSGTIGQHDAGPTPLPMTGGSFSLTGGFWTVTVSCFCPGDLNGDGKRNGSDVQLFVACLLAGSGNCACADADVMNGLTVADVPVFVNKLLTATTCP